MHILIIAAHNHVQVCDHSRYVNGPEKLLLLLLLLLLQHTCLLYAPVCGS